MTVESYLQRMAEHGVERGGLETGIAEFSRASVRSWKESPYLPAGQDKSMIPLKPEPHDYSAMNGPAWHSAQKLGKHCGRPKAK